LAIGWRLARRRPLGLAATGVLLALALLLPSLLGVVRSADGDALRIPTRYFHLPLAGVLLSLLPAATRLWSRGLRYAAPAVIALLCLLSWMRAEQWQDEISFFTAEAAYHPDSSTDSLNAVARLTRAHAFGAAAAELDRAESLPGADAPRTRSRALSERAAILVLRDGDVEGATRLLERAIAAWPGDLGNLLDLASVRMTAGHPEQAVELLDGALASPLFRDRRRAEIEARRRKYLAAIDAAGRGPGDDI
jgi:tetratricopeptide (TPR) repeat protein